MGDEGSTLTLEAEGLARDDEVGATSVLLRISSFTLSSFFSTGDRACRGDLEFEHL